MSDDALNKVSQAVIVVAVDGRIRRANEAAEALLAYPLAVFEQMRIAELIPETQRPDFEALHHGFARAPSAPLVLRELSLITGADDEVPAELHLARLNENGESDVVITVHDLTRERSIEARLAESELRFHTLSLMSSDWYWRQDAQFRFTYLSGVDAEGQFNDHSKVIGKTRFELPYDFESEQARAEHMDTLSKGAPFSNLLIRNCLNDHYAMISGDPMFNSKGEFCGYQGIGRDVTAEKRAARQLRESESRFRALTALSSDWYWEQDESLCFTYLSPTAYSNSKVPADTMLGHTTFELPIVWESEAAKEEHARTLEQRLPYRDLLLHTVSGDQYTYVSGEPFFDDEGTFRGYRGVTKDVTAQKKAEAQALRLATRDALTGLPNRTLFIDRVQRSIARALRESQKLAVLFVDLDRFKMLNDSFGHSVGDEFLSTVSKRIGSILRRSDTLSRFGGDEFVLLLENLQNDADADLIAQKVLAILSETVDLHGVRFQTTASIGISMFPNDGNDSETLVRNADLAMYEAKEAGRGCVRFFSREMNIRIAQKTALDLELKQAIGNKEFELYFHPQRDILTDKVVGAEVLLRWNHPDKGIVSPGDFISAAEETGLIVPIGRFVLDSAFATISSWLQSGFTPPRIAVNISARQLLDEDGLLDHVKSLLEATQVPPDLIEFEITESLLIPSDNDGKPNILETLGQLGIRLSIDDFGTGYSSLSYLKRLPVNAIKIDRAFVKDIAVNEESSAIVKAVVGLAGNMKLEVVAEGVETEQQLEVLRQIGCSTYQGFMRETPMSRADFEERILSRLADNVITPLPRTRVASH